MIDNNLRRDQTDVAKIRAVADAELTGLREQLGDALEDRANSDAKAAASAIDHPHHGHAARPGQISRFPCTQERRRSLTGCRQHSPRSLSVREDGHMSTDDETLQPVLEWHFVIAGRGIDIYDSPGFDGPDTWLAAIAAVARDLHCLRHGKDINVDRIIWGLAITDDWSVMVSWQGPRLDVSGYSFRGLTMDTPFEEAVVWIADTVQTEFAGHQFVQWPSHGQRLLEPRLDDDGPVWVDTANGEPVAAIGNLCMDIT